MIEICSQILAALCTEVILESRYKTPLSSGRPMPASITCSHIGIGSNATWHGTPDARVRGGGGCSLMYSKSDIEHESESGVSDSDSDSGTNVTEKSSGSDAMTSLIEGKVSFNDIHLRQAVAVNVVFSFTEKSCHPDKPASVPTILIDQNGFRVSLRNLLPNQRRTQEKTKKMNSLNPLNSIVHFWLHHTAHCAEKTVSARLHAGSASAERVGQVEVGGVIGRVLCTWWLLGLALKRPWLVPRGLPPC